MSRLFRCCCCCFCDENSEAERQPLLQSRPSEPNKPESARQARPADTQALGRGGRLAVRRVCVPELDRRFCEAAEAFNEQHARHAAMEQHLDALHRAYGRHHDDTPCLTECLKRIQEEHEGRYRVTLRMKGYDFSLSVAPLASQDDEGEEPVPRRLRLAQDELRGVSQCAKATVSAGTKLQELIGWLLRSEERMAEQVKEAAPTYQEEGRLDENLRETMQEVRRARELSLGFKQRAGDVLTEAALMAGQDL